VTAIYQLLQSTDEPCTSVEISDNDHLT